MAFKKLYAGSTGPSLYDDTSYVGDAEGDFSGVLRHASVTDGQHWVGEAPTEPEHVVRKTDLDAIITGMITLWDASSAIPTGWAHCDGSAVSLDLTASEPAGALYIQKL